MIETLESKSEGSIEYLNLGNKEYNVLVHGPKGSIDITQEYLSKKGFKIKRDLKNASAISFELKTIFLPSTVGDNAATTFELFHEIAHLRTSDPTRDSSSYKEKVENYAAHEELAWIECFELCKEIFLKTGYDLRTNFDSFEEFFIQIKNSYESYQKYYAEGNDITWVKEIFNIEKIRSKLEVKWNEVFTNQ